MNLKDITVEEYNDLPKEVKEVYWRAMNNIPITLTMLDVLTKNHPEYLKS